MSKDKLLDQIGEYQLIGRALEAECRAFCTNSANSLDERWELFKVAPNKDHWSNDRHPDFVDSCYDELGLARGETFRVVERVSHWEKEFEKEGRCNRFDSNGWDFNRLNEFKLYYLDRYLGSWEHDW